MKISEIIEIVKKNCRGYGEIDDNRTRDKVLYGETDKECTGIVTTIYASVDVIRKAHELGANFIIAHEACFWNHGDKTDWLQDNDGLPETTVSAVGENLPVTGIILGGQYAQNFDYDSIDEALAEMKNYQIPEDEQPVFQKLKDVVENFDYDMVSDVISEKIK